MDRFFLPPDQWSSPSLSGEEAHHCSRVMRKLVGAEIEVFDGAGRSAVAKIEAISGREVALNIGGAQETSPAPVELTLAVGIPKGKLMELIIQKAVELGVSRIVPLLCEHGNVALSGKEAEKKAEKWRRVVLESCKQCGQNHLPQLLTPLTLHDYLSHEKQEGTKLIAALLPESRSLRDAFPHHEEAHQMTFLVGPEGDFSQKEYALAQAHGFQPVSLGKLILRVETAVFMMLGSAQCLYHQE